SCSAAREYQARKGTDRRGSRRTHLPQTTRAKLFPYPCGPTPARREYYGKLTSFNLQHPSQREKYRASCARSFLLSINNRQLGEICGRIVGNTQDDDGAVVMRKNARATVTIRGVNNSLRNLVTRFCYRNCGEQRHKPVDTEFFFSGILCFLDAIGREHYDVPDFQRYAALIVFNSRQQPERDACQQNLLNRTAANQQRVRRAGVCHREGPRRSVIHGESHGNKSRI